MRRSHRSTVQRIADALLWFVQISSFGLLAAVLLLWGAGALSPEAAFGTCIGVGAAVLCATLLSQGAR